MARPVSREIPVTPAASRELELCFAVPTSQLDALRRALDGRSGAARTVRLQARYFDTPTAHLAAAGMALRVRREGRRWVQTLKTAEPGELARREFDVLRSDGSLDLEALSTTPASRVLARAGVVPAEALHVVYETSIRRRVRALRVKGATVELALDEGAIVAGGHRMRVREIEFELVRGEPQALFELAALWQRRFGLTVEPRSKAERGHALLGGGTVEPPRKAAPVALQKAMSPVRALRAVAMECAEQVQHNAAALVGAGGHEEHVHQLRVGLRRLRSAWRFFAPWTPPLPEGLAEGAQSLFARLGVSRDAAVQAGDLWPRLVAAGMPDHGQAAGAGHGASDQARAEAASLARSIAEDPEVQAWMLSLLGWIERLEDVPAAWPAPSAGAGSRGVREGEPQVAPAGDRTLAEQAATDAARGAGPVPGDAVEGGTLALGGDVAEGGATTEPPSLRELLRRRLGRWHRSVAIGGEPFLALELEQQHALRKRAKRLRYATEFCAALLDPKPLRLYLKRLGRLQDDLGELNDLAVASSRLADSKAADPAAWFARGWIAARVEAVRGDAAAALDRLPARPPAFGGRGGRRERR
jgi:inorganic triphosphatase YgiF